MRKSPKALSVGDRFIRDDAIVTVLRPSEPCRDRFGRPMYRYWCSRSDTGAEGWMTYGPGAVDIEVMP